MLGFLVLVACAALSASLLTWSAADPSLTRATSGAARNLLGPPGAILSDMLIQMLGLAGVFVLLPPLFWALRLLTSEQPPGLRGKLVLAPLAVLFLAGALSSLPSASSWPLHHGYGGVLGDLGLGLLASLLAHVNADRSSAAAGLFYFAAGLMVLMSSLGLTREELRLICQTNAQPNLRAVAGWCRELYDRMSSYRASMPPSATPDPVREPPVLHLERRPTLVEPDAAEAADYGEDVPSSGRDASFDRLTERTSHEIAKRFAPAASEAQPAAVERPAPTLDVPPAEEREYRGQGQVAPRRPPLSLLRRPATAKAGAVLTQAELRGQARLLGEVLADFGIKGEIKDVHPGPVVTLHEFEPARGVKSARVIGLADDIGRSMGAACVRADVIPGRNAIGIELPNPRREKVLLRELLDSEAFRATDATLPLALGKNIAGTAVFADLARMPHLLVAGTTGSGKSVGVNAMILSLLYRLSPEQCRFLMIDPKMLELSVYNGIPHLLCPVVTEPAKAVAALNWVVAEMEQRYQRMSTLAVRNIDAFNDRVRSAQKRVGPGAPATAASRPRAHALHRRGGRRVRRSDARRGQGDRGRGAAAGADGAGGRHPPDHGDAASLGRHRHGHHQGQLPHAHQLQGGLQVRQPHHPQPAGGGAAAGRGRHAVLERRRPDPARARAVRIRRGGGKDCRLPAGPGRAPLRRRHYRRRRPEEEPDPGAKRARPAENDLYDRAVDIVLNERKASTSYLQRRLTIGYNRAADLMERMERDGIVSAPGFRGRRQILLEEGATRGEQW